MGGCLLAVLVVAGGTPSAFAQNTEPDSTQWTSYQVGFDASSFVRLLEGAEAPEDYQLYARYRLNQQWTIRTALRYRHFLDENQEIRLGGRVGADRVFRSEERWQLYIGSDVLAAYDRFLSGNRTRRVGIAPLLGVQYSITDHFSLSVEPRLTARYAASSPNSAEENTETFTIELRGTGLLIFSVHF